jgi:hypothetical protein
MLPNRHGRACPGQDSWADVGDRDFRSECRKPMRAEPADNSEPNELSGHVIGWSNTWPMSSEECRFICVLCVNRLPASALNILPCSAAPQSWQCVPRP